MDKETLLYSYFSNSLTEDERKQFHKLLETDAGFKEQFELELNLKRAIRDKKNKDLKAKLIDFERDIEKSSRPSISKLGIRKWSIAASVALLMALGWYGYNALSGTDYEHLYASNFEAYPNTVYTITRSDGNRSLERDAFAAYESEDYEQAVALFSKAKNQEEIAHRDFYLAQCYLNLDKNKEAIELFSKVILEDSKFEAEANWYLALTYLKKEDNENAISTLNRQVKMFDYNKTKARDLLKALN